MEIELAEIDKILKKYKLKPSSKNFVEILEPCLKMFFGVKVVRHLSFSPSHFFIQYQYYINILTTRKLRAGQTVSFFLLFRMFRVSQLPEIFI